MTATSPQWSDSGQGDLLELVAQGNPSLPTADEEWQVWLTAAASVAAADGTLRPNRLRPLIDAVAPQRRGAFVNRAIARGLMVPNGWEITEGSETGNDGKPARTYRWLGSP